MIWAGHLARMGKMINAYVLVRETTWAPKRRWEGQPASGKGPVPGSCEHGNEIFGSERRLASPGGFAPWN
jgi:hypothetical protein